MASPGTKRDDAAESASAQADVCARTDLAQELASVKARVSKPLTGLQHVDAQLMHAQKMSSIGQLAAGVAHDFNNLLLLISAHVHIAADSLPKDHAAQATLNAALKATSQAAAVTRTLLTFSHPAAPEKTSHNLAELFRETVRLMVRVLPKNIDLISSVDSASMTANVDGTQIQQVLMNLALNARDAMPSGGRLRISLKRVPVRDGSGSAVTNSYEPARSPSPLPTGFVAELVVTDTGTGMAPEVLERIFEPFFTTKQRGQGTGLGLAVIKSIIDDHGGSIKAESRVDHGTRVTVTIPLLDKDVETSRETTGFRPVPKGHGQLVLLAEDNRNIRDIMAVSLQAAGYNTIQCEDGPSILEALKEHADQVELLVVDVELPGEGGLQCLRKIRESGCGTPAVVITGSHGIGEEHVLDRRTHLLPKPFDLSQLGQVVHDMLCSHPK